MRVCLIVALAAAVVVGCGGAVWAAEITAVQASAAQVPRYGKLELAPQITGQWSNPYDPDQVDVSAEFTAPSGKTLTMPGFWYQEHTVTTMTAAQARQHMTMLKLYIEEKGVWSSHPSVEFFLDDVELRESATGKRVLLDDMEKPETRWYIPRWVAPSEELAHGGTRSLRFRTEIGGEEEWPGAILPLNGADWSAYDGLSLWVYPRVGEPLGMINLYFSDACGGNSPITGWQVGSAELKPNQWNHLTWDWRGFPTRCSWEPKGAAGWRVRFCPTEPGRWTYRVRVRDRAGTAVSEPGSFGCVPSDSPGFVRISRDDPHYFDFDNGKAFVPIGHDVAWGVADARVLFPKMKAAGENCTYFIMMPDDTDIEWAKLGEYSLSAAAKMDTLVEAAGKSDIYLKLSFDVHDSLRAGASWERNPYSAKRGGPCTGPNDFYTDPEARKLYQRRLRYIAARWGYSTHIIAWEPVAEIDGGVERDGQAGWGYPGKPGGEAVTAMLTSFLKGTYSYLRQVCPYERLFTNSFGGDVSDPAIWALPEVQYTQLHHYDSVDVGRTMSEWCARLTGDFPKPLMVTEFCWWADWTKPFLDREGVCQHNGIWASLLGGAAGSAQSWWWEHIDEWNLYPHYLALRRFVEGVDFPREGFRLAQAATQTPPGGQCGPVRFLGSGPFVNAKVAEFTVLPDGSVTDAPEAPGYLLAAGRPEARVNPTFHLTCPQDCTFSLHVEAVSPDAELTVFVDGQPVLKRDLPAENVPGKRCIFSERWKLWECRYDEDVTVPLTAGRHDVRLENTKPGISWIRVTSYALSNYAPAALRVVGLQGRRLSLLWLQNTQHTWVNAIGGFKPVTISGATVTLQGVPDGTRTVEWWDTYEGRRIGSVQVTAAGGQLVLPVSPLDRDIACKIKG
jgi:hypothetical protein